MRGGTLWLSLVGLAAACATGEDVEGTSAASFSGPTVTASASASATAANTGVGSGTDAESGTAVDSGDADPSADAASDGTPMGPGMQPQDGMYSDCLMAGECVGLNTCVTILDTMENPTDGFCSNNACETPAEDCDATPAGDTTPFCMSLILNGQEDTVCALDCSGDRPCPGGMICWDLGAVQVCA